MENQQTVNRRANYQKTTIATATKVATILPVGEQERNGFKNDRMTKAKMKEKTRTPYLYTLHNDFSRIYWLTISESNNFMVIT